MAIKIQGTTILDDNRNLLSGNTITGATFAAANGLASAPSFDFTNDPNTGMFLAAADTIGFATNGTTAAQITSTGNLRLFNTAGTLYTEISNQPTANNTLTFPTSGDITLVSGTMVPTTGTGATGTWAISVTGNANTATALSGASFVQSTGRSASWGSTSGTSTGAFNAIMGTASSATWLLSGTSGGTFRSGIQSLDADGTLRFYQGTNFFTFSGNTITASTFSGALSGNATTATTATNITGGVAGGVPYQTGAGATAITAAGTAGQALVSAGAAAPVFTTLTLENLPDAWVKRSCRVATTANITLSGTQTIDGIAVVAGDRVLVKDQTAQAENGIYVVAAGAWSRAGDANVSSELAGAQVAVDLGTTWGGTTWDTDFKSTDTLGTTAMTWALILDSNRLVTSGSTATPAAVRYNGTTATAGQFDGGTTTPTGTTRLNYGGYIYPTALNLVGQGDTTTAATHYFVETGSDGFVRPKTLANVQSEIVTTSAVNSAAATTVGTVTAGTWNAGVIAGQYGGTGVNNTGRTITLNGNISTANSFTTAGNFATTLTVTGATNVTLPTTGTLATTGNLSQFAATTSAQLAGVISDETGTGALVFGTSPAFAGVPTAPTAAVGTSNTQLATTAFVNAEIANDAPTRTGGGASGTWAISVTGNANTVTNGVYDNTIQTISGAKTFSALTLFTSNVAIGSTNAVERLQVEGNIRALSYISANGSATSPSFDFVSDPNTGMYLAGPDTLAFTTNGIERIRISSNGAIGFGGSLFGTAGQVLTSVGSNTAPIWTDPSGATDGENKIINGSFEVWQRGTDFTTGVYIGYTADRWYLDRLGGNASAGLVLETIGTTFGSNNPRQFLRFSIANQTLSTHTSYIEQRIESARSYAGQTITVLGWARRSSGAGNMAIAAYQYFGTGGSPSAATTVPGQQVALTGSWQPFAVTMNIPSLTGKTVGTNANDSLIIRIFGSAGSSIDAGAASLGLQSIGIDLWGIHIKVGTHTTDAVALYRAPDYASELIKCQRYCAIIDVSIQSASSGFTLVPWVTPVDMRATPALIVAGAGSAVNATVSSDAVLNFRSGYLQIQATAGSGYVVGRTYRLDAEL